jgi:16S rRNA (cytosine967-C5)-methyltransferase
MKDNARSIALSVLEKVEKSGAYSNISLNQSIQKSNLNDKDKGLLTEIVYGTIQRKKTIDYYISLFVKKDLKKLDVWVLSLLRLSLYQMIYLDKIPDHAVINEAVLIAKKRGHKGISGFINGVLRSVQRHGDIEIKGIKEKKKLLAIKYSMPEWLIARWIEQFGEEETAKMCEVNLQKPPITARVNTYKTDVESVMKQFDNEEISVTKTNLAPNAIEVKSGNLLTSSVFKKGLITIQDESSMLVGLALGVERDLKVLDACAAPGGKTTHIAELMGNEGEVYALDLHEHKIDLIKNKAKILGLTNIQVYAKDSRKAVELFEEESFDRILLDAPCSGFGVIRRKPEIKWSKTETDIINIANVQEQLLESVSKLLKPGGILVYSTCTIDKEENEEQIEKFLQKNSDFRPDNELLNRLPDQVKPYVQDNAQVQLLPHYFGTDGFYIAAMRKG